MFARMRTSHKIFGGFLAAQAIVMLVSGAAYLGSQHVRRQVDALAQQQFASTQALTMLNVARLQTSGALNALMMKHATDRSLRGSFYDEVDGALKQVEIARRDFDAVPRSDAVEALWRKL